MSPTAETSPEEPNKDSSASSVTKTATSQTSSSVVQEEEGTGDTSTGAAGTGNHGHLQESSASVTKVSKLIPGRKLSPYVARQKAREPPSPPTNQAPTSSLNRLSRTDGMLPVNGFYFQLKPTV